MEMDNYKEQIVQPSSSLVIKVVNVCMWILFAAAFILMIFGGIVYSLAYLVLGIVIFFTKKFLYVEYEYSFTNGLFEIDAIYQQKSRKKLVEFDIKDISLFAPLDSDEYKSCNYNKNNVQKVVKAVPKGSTDKVYCIVANKGAQKYMIYVTPDEELIDLCYMRNPRIVKKVMY